MVNNLLGISFSLPAVKLNIWFITEFQFQLEAL